MAHRLEIEPGVIGGYALKGTITFDDGTTAEVYADERARVIAKAQQAIQQFRTAKETAPEVLMLDEFGEILREPIEWSRKAR